MRVDSLVSNQLLMAQAIDALADHVNFSTGFHYTPIPFAGLPTLPTAGMVQVINDSTVNTWGSVVAGGGGFTVLSWYNGTDWTVVGA